MENFRDVEIEDLLGRDAVELDNKNILHWNRTEVAKHLAVLTQRPSLQLHITVYDFVAFGRFPYTKNHLSTNDKTTIAWALDQVGIQALQHAYIDELSGGQQQLAYIALILAQNTQYMLFDEPIANLDIAHALSIIKLLRQLCEQHGKTIVLVLHELPYAAFFSDYVCALQNGHIAYCGTPQQVLTQKNLLHLYGVEFETMAYGKHFERIVGIWSRIATFAFL